MTITYVFLATLLSLALTCWALDPAAAEWRVSGFGSRDSWAFSGQHWSLAEELLTQSDVNAVRTAFYTGQTLSDVSVQCRFRVKPKGRGVRTAGLVLRSIGPQRGYFVHYDTRNDQIILMRGDPLSPFVDEITRRRGVKLVDNRWYAARVSMAGRQLKVYLDDELILEAEDDRYEAGRVGLYTSQGHVEFTDLQVHGKPAPMKSPWRAARCAVPEDQPLATILGTKVLCKQPGRYIGWPTIAIAPNGDLLVVFSGDRDAHVSPDGKTQMVRSRDGGETWSDPVTINDLPIDDRDAGLLRSSQGTLIASWFTGPPYHTELQGHYVIRSTDNGYTWSQRIRTQVTTPHGPIQLADGRLLFIGLRPHCSHTKPANYNGPPAGALHTVCVEESQDDGLTWRVVSTFPVPADARMLSFDEPHMVETANGAVIAQFRDCNAPQKLWQSKSTDGGLTWSPPHRTPLHGYPPHLIRLSNGYLLSTYAKRWQPYGEYASVSRDGGETWDVDHEIQLSCAPSSDLGYPASAELADGTIWTVYYEVDVPGERPCLKGTHWRPK